MPKLFLFGDSITWGAWDLEGGGWAQRLRTALDSYTLSNEDYWCPVYSLGVSGDRSAGLAARLEQETSARLAEDGQVIILIAIGINDSKIDLKDPANNVTETQYAENLGAILKKAKLFSNKISFMGLTPINQELLDPLPWDTTLAYRMTRVQSFEATCQKFCADNDIPFLSLIDSWLRMDYNSLLEDGLHPNSKGHQLLFESVKAFLVNTRFLIEPFEGHS